MESRKLALDRRVWGACLFLAPLMLAASTFFWEGGEYGTVGGALAVAAMVLWIPALIGLFELAGERMPRYASWGLPIAVYGAVGGAVFGFRDLYAAALGIAQPTELSAFSAHPIEFAVTLFLPGPLFVLSLLLLGVNLARSKAVPAWVSLLFCLGAIAFPGSRVARIQPVAHLADLLLLVPMVVIAWAFVTAPPTRSTVAVSSPSTAAR